MKEQLATIRSEALAAFAQAGSSAELDALRVKYLGKKGELTAVLKQMGKLPAEERPAMGQLANEVRAALEAEPEAKGIRVGDIVTQVNGRGVRQTSDVSAIISEYEVGDIMTFTIFRDGETLYVDVELVDTSDIY